jgi:hypothetical protein
MSPYRWATMYKSDFDKGKLRDVTVMHQQADAWWYAQNSKKRDEISIK